MPADAPETSDTENPIQCRLSDLIAQAIFRAFDVGETDIAAHLVAALKIITERECQLMCDDRRAQLNTLVEAKERLNLATTVVGPGITRLGSKARDTAVEPVVLIPLNYPPIVLQQVLA